MPNFIKLVIFIFLLSSKTLLAEVISISPTEIKELMAKNIPLIDVRREDEWQSTGVIAHSHLLTFFDKNGKYNFSKFVQKLNKIDNIKEGMILFCRTGRRTTLIANAIEKTGAFNIIYNTKGVIAWSSGNNSLINYKQK